MSDNGPSPTPEHREFVLHLLATCVEKLNAIGATRVAGEIAAIAFDYDRRTATTEPTR